MRRLGPLMTAMVKTGNKPTKQETPRYCCELCKKLFSRNYRLVAHMLKFHGIVCAKKKKLVPTPDNPRPHKCDLCEKAFVRRKLLQRHRIAKHISSTCPECNTEIVKLKLKEHMLAAHGKTLQLPYECYLCKHQYKSKLKLQTHMQAIHCDMHQLFRCPLCTEVLTSRDEYRRHRGRHKYDRSKFSKRICEKCGKEVIGSHFRNHERTHLDRSIKCSYCEKRFKYTAAVKLHERTHTQERPYECKVCYSRFIDGSRLRIHHRSHTGESPFLCHLCGRRTKQAQNLASHYRHFHRNSDVTSREIRFNARVFERYSQDELERCLSEDGDLTRLLALGTIEHNKELEEQNRAKELEEQRKFENFQRQNVLARIYQKEVLSSKVTVPMPTEEVLEVPPIEQVNVDTDNRLDAEGQIIVSGGANTIEFAEVKIEPALDVFDEAADCGMSDFVATCDIKVEEPLELADTIDGTFDDDPDSEAESNEAPTATPELVEESTISAADPNGLLVEMPGNVESDRMEDASERLTAKSSFCDICKVQYSHRSAYALHMIQMHGIQAVGISRPHKCKLCEKSYGKSSHLWRHVQTRHNSVSDWSRLVGRRIKIKPVSAAPRERRVLNDKTSVAALNFCHICDIYYANPTVCATHMVQVHGVAPSDVPDIPRPHKCLLCDKSYGRSSHLWRHYEAQHGGAPTRNMKKMMAVMRQRKMDVEIVKGSDDIDPGTANDSVHVAAELDMIPENVTNQDAGRLGEVNPGPSLERGAGEGPEETEAIAEEQEDENLLEEMPDKATMTQLSYCHICRRKYTSQLQCSTHMLEVHDIKLPDIPRPHKCLLCDKSYVKTTSLSMHYARVHKDADNLKIKLDGMEIVQHGSKPSGVPSVIVKSENPVDAEPLTPPTYCSICDRDYASRKVFTVHMWGVHKIEIPSTRPHRCVITTCKKSYKARRTLLIHYRRDHGGNPERHMKTIKDKPSKKREPRRERQTEPNLVESKGNMSEERAASRARSVCLLCDKQYANHSGCAAHMLQVHKIMVPEIDRPFSCHKCDRSYVKSGHLARHLKSGHSTGPMRVGQKVSAFECYMCRESFDLRDMLKKHMSKSHLPDERSSICPTCGILTQRLARHIYNSHTIKEVTCTVCQRVFRHPTRLSSHMKTHTLPYQCDMCPKRFSSNGQMRQHRRYHTLERPYSCSHCESRFFERSTLTQHERIHTGEKPYRCHLCDTRTIQAGNLKSHYRHFHKVTVKRVSMTKLVTDDEMTPI